MSAETRETGVLDFKGFADPRTLWEHSKDLAAFANALGGVLVVGAVEGPAGELVYPGLQAQSSKEVQTIYEHAARLCSPPPTIDPVPIRRADDRVVVAVNVAPSLDLIAAPVRTRDVAGNWVRHDQGWFFPRRVGSQTNVIEPSEAPLYTTRDTRRGYLLIDRMPQKSRKQVRVFHAHLNPRSGYGSGVVQYAETVLALVDVSAERNFVEFHYNAGKCIIRVPLMDVLDVWEHLDGKWSLRLAGGLGKSGDRPEPEFVYIPLWR